MPSVISPLFPSYLIEHGPPLKCVNCCKPFKASEFQILGQVVKISHYPGNESVEKVQHLFHNNCLQYANSEKFYPSCPRCFRKIDMYVPITAHTSKSLEYRPYMQAQNQDLEQIPEEIAREIVNLDITDSQAISDEGVIRFPQLKILLCSGTNVAFHSENLLPSLEYLDVSDCSEIDDRSVEYFPRNLLFLNLTKTKITSQGLCRLANNQQNLKYLYVQQCAVSKEALRYFEQLHPNCLLVVDEANVKRHDTGKSSS